MYRTYWIVWAALLLITVSMVVMDQMAMPRTVLVAVLLSVMSIKAVLIAGYFMHLRLERWPLILGIVFGLPINAAILYVLITPDARRIFEMLQRP